MGPIWGKNQGQVSISSNQEEKNLLPPLSTVLKIDTHLRLGTKDFKKFLKPLLRSNNSTDDRKFNVHEDAFPNAYELSQLSLKVYEVKQNGETDGDYEEKLDLPSGWMLLTTAVSEYRLNKYFGAAFLHLKKRQIVVAHRGTEMRDLGANRTNLTNVVCKFSYLSPRVSSAVTFADLVITALKDVEAVGLTFTGHSLGGWLAQITCFTSLYLHSRESHFVKNDPDQGIHCHTVTFESPGCRNTLNQLKMQYDLRCSNSMSLKILDITTYLSAPNAVNCINFHLGTILRIFPDVSNFNIIDRHSMAYHFAVHQMLRISQVFSEQTGDVAENKDGKLNVEAVIDWPGRRKEYRNFFNRANHSNNYRPSYKNAIARVECAVSRYKTKILDEKSCSLATFSQNELLFLKAYLTFKEWNMKSKTLEELTLKFNLGDYRYLLPEFFIDQENHKLRCDSKLSLSRLINCTKQLMRWALPDLMKVIKESTGLSSVGERIIEFQFTEFSHSMIECAVEFEEVKELTNFLTSETQQVLYITTSDIEFEAVRTNILCKRIQDKTGIRSNGEEKYIDNSRGNVLSWQQLLREFLDIKTFLTTKSNIRYLIIVADPMQSEINEKSKHLLDDVFSVVCAGRCSKKIIFITSKNGFVDTYIPLHRDMCSTLTRIDARSICFSDLTRDSQNNLLEKHIILLNGTQYSLIKLLTTTDRGNDDDLISTVNEVDSSVLKKIIVPDPEIIILQNELMEFYEQNVLYAKICKKVPPQQAVNFLCAKIISQNVSKPVVFYISGIPENSDSTEEMFRRLCISDIEQRKTIRKALNSSIFMNSDDELKFKEFCLEHFDKQIYWLKVENNDVTWDQVYDQNFYIPRYLNDQIHLKKDVLEAILEDSCSDMFIFSNCSKQSLANFFGESKDKCQMISMCANTEFLENNAYNICENDLENDGSVHFVTLEEKAETIIWLKSTGSMDSIREHAVPKMPLDEQGFCEKDDSLILFCGDSGIGKSVTLHSLTRYMKSSWVFRRELKYSDLPTVHNMNNVVAFLTGSNHSNSNNLTAVLLKACLTREDAIPVLLIFDEIKEEPMHSDNEYENSSEKVIKLIEFLNEHTRANVWVTCRTNKTRKFEDHFSVFSTTFENLKQEEQKQFLKLFWKARLAVELKGWGEREERTVERFAETFFQNAKSTSGKAIGTLMDIPSHMRMIAEIAQPDAELFTMSTSSFSVQSAPLKNVLDIYKRVIEAHYVTYFQKKSENNAGTHQKWIINKLNELHRRLSFQLLFPDECETFFDGEEVCLSKRMRMTDEKNALNEVGLVHSNGTGEFRFCNNHFAEFFATEVFIDCLSKSHKKYIKVNIEEFLLSNVLTNPNFRFIRLLLNNSLESNKISFNTADFYSERLNGWWQNTLLHSDNATALDVVSCENLGELVEFVLTMLDSFVEDKDVYIKLIGRAFALSLRWDCGESIAKFKIKFGPEQCETLLTEKRFRSIK